MMKKNGEDGTDSSSTSSDSGNTPCCRYAQPAAMAGAVLLGAMISLMIMINGRLSQEAGQNSALLIIHLTGLSAVQLILLTRTGRIFMRKQLHADTARKHAAAADTDSSYPRTAHISIEAAEHPAGEEITVRDSSQKTGKKRIPPLLYSGGVIGVLMIFGNNICFDRLGTSLTLAAGILGQSAASLVIDSTGFLGMPRYRFRSRKLIGLSLNAAGIIMMVTDWRLNLLFLLFALFVGSLTIIQMSLNAQLAVRTGLFRGVRINYIGGTAASAAALLLVFMLSQKQAISGETAFQPALLGQISPLFLLGGGLLGVLIVTGSNIILPRIPTIYTSLLNFFGQITAALIIDALLFDMFSVRRMRGAVLILAGIAVNVYIDKKSKKKE